MSTPMRLLADACIGTVIGGRYEVTRVLGCGGMGFVLAATHQLTGGKVALKIVPDTEKSSLERLMLEARAPAMVRHPNLVEVHDVGYDEQKNMYFMVQELLEGSDLRTHLDARGRLPWREAISLLTPVMDALSAVHEAGVVHRDLKPENLFLSQEHGGVIVPRVLDFGIVRMLNRKDRLTTVGSTLGTPWYLSPSAARGEQDISTEGDVWSMGVILFECISGALPFDGENYNAVMNAIVSTKAPRLDSIMLDVPPAVVDVIARALEHDRSRRFQTMGEMMRALLEAAGDVARQPTILPPRVEPIISRTRETESMRPVVSERAKPALVIAATFVIVLSVLFGVRAMATPRAPLVMRAITPEMVHVHVAPVTRLSVATAEPVQVARVVRRTPATRGRTQASSAPPARVRTVAVARVARNGAPVFEP